MELVNENGVSIVKEDIGPDQIKPHVETNIQPNQ